MVSRPQTFLKIFRSSFVLIIRLQGLSNGTPFTFPVNINWLISLQLKGYNITAYHGYMLKLHFLVDSVCSSPRVGHHPFHIGYPQYVPFTLESRPVGFGMSRNAETAELLPRYINWISPKSIVCRI